MPYLSLLTLARTSLRWQLLTSYQVHQMVWKAFPAAERGDPQRFLYRHDESDSAHSLLVQSALPPDWGFLDQVPGVQVQVKGFDPAALQPDTRLRFFLRANPVVRRKGYEDGKVRHILVGSDRRRIADRLGMVVEELPSREEQLVDWLARKGRDAGFALEECVPGESRTYVLHRPRGPAIPREQTGREPMTFVGIDFAGVLRVADAGKFSGALLHGIGRGKAFGFGLLSVARAQ